MNQISPKASIYGNVEIGDNVRIDDFCILTGNIKIGSHIHIGAYSFFSGREGIIIEDFAQFGPRVSILTGSDDYSGNSMVGPMIPDEYKPDLANGAVAIKRHALLGINTVVMPGVILWDGACTGAFTFVKEDLLPWSMYVGCPAHFLRPRSKNILELERSFLNGYNDKN